MEQIVLIPMTIYHFHVLAPLDSIHSSLHPCHSLVELIHLAQFKDSTVSAKPRFRVFRNLVKTMEYARILQFSMPTIATAMLQIIQELTVKYTFHVVQILAKMELIVKTRQTTQTTLATALEP